jgi:hypothetical protein
MDPDISLHIRSVMVFLSLLLRNNFNAGHICLFTHTSYPFLQYVVTYAAYKCLLNEMKT